MLRLLVVALLSSTCMCVWAQALPNPILFVTQTPPPQTFESIGEVFLNHTAGINAAPRGGDLWMLYPDGSLKNLTAAAGYGVASGLMQSPGPYDAPDFPYAADPKGTLGGIAVRDPEVHWSGDKAVFSMAIGTPARYQTPTYRWQLFEISGLGKNATPEITRVPNQPPYNNVQPIYASDGRIIFASDRPRGGLVHLYPQLDEYESTPIVTGLYALDPAAGTLETLTHSPSGDFNPLVASDGRIVFTRWDHLIRDQQADSTIFGTGYDYGAFTYADESADAARMPLSAYHEVFPEPRTTAYAEQLYPGQHMVGHAFNFFFPWQINQDGSGIETLQHVGRHELVGSFEASRSDDAALKYFNFQDPMRANQHELQDIFAHLREDPIQPGRFVGVVAPEFGARSAGQLVALSTVWPNGQAEQIRGSDITHPDTFGFNADDAPAKPNDSGKYRNPLPLSNGDLIAVHTSETRTDKSEITTEAGCSFNGQTLDCAHPRVRYDFRLRRVTLQANGFAAASGAFLTGNGIRKTLSYYGPDNLVKYDDVLMWELDPVEVRARPAPVAAPEQALEAPELAMFAAAGVDPAPFRAWLKENGLAVISIRNVTTREGKDKQQPFNLKVAGSNTETRDPASTGRTYDIAALQIFQGDQVRGYFGAYGTIANPKSGRRVLARPMHDAPNPDAPGAPSGSALIASDGSVAAFVPANRALTWQTVAPDHTPVVRERMWLSTRPGEIRVCTSCHGINVTDQAGHPPPVNAPIALKNLLDWWKGTVADVFFDDGFEN